MRDRKNEIEKQQHVAEKQVTMVVFVHGTVIPYFSFKTFFAWLKHSELSYMDQLKRYGIYKYQPVDFPGLHNINIDEEIDKDDIKFYGWKTAKVYKKLHDIVNPKSEEVLKFYTYNWSGDLSKTERKKAAKELYRSLVSEKDKLIKIGNTVSIYILGHSHAMNVILNLADINNDKNAEELSIDKVVFFGGPVQTETERFVNSPIFKNIYHMWSDNDMVQRIDLVSTKDFFSRRLFGISEKNTITLPKTLKQIKVEVGEYNPRHYELWLWGSKGSPDIMYRKCLPIHPLPVSVFTPVIMSLADSLDTSKNVAHSCILSMYRDVKTISMTCDNQKVSQQIDFSSII